MRVFVIQAKNTRHREDKKDPGVERCGDGSLQKRARPIRIGMQSLKDRHRDDGEQDTGVK